MEEISGLMTKYEEWKSKHKQNNMKYIKKENKIVLDESAITIQLAELVTQKQSLEHQQLRAREYPRIGDQLDMLWHAIDSGTLNKTSDFYTTIKAVKDTYPKSE
jgi:phosphomevalonate kinase